FINEATTLHRHLQSLHRGEYLQWAAINEFPSMLPQDSKRRREEASLQSQSSLDSHLVPKDRVVQYSDSAFREAAIRWLINTDQPIHALQHPDFKMMIDVASRAPTTAGVKIPSHGKTREVIIDLFKASLSDLRTHFQVSHL
ncbi:hypothetical protein EDD15DRAFT_2160881, partial [Pisolithus albus]